MSLQASTIRRENELVVGFRDPARETNIQCRSALATTEVTWIKHLRNAIFRLFIMVIVVKHFCLLATPIPTSELLQCKLNNFSQVQDRSPKRHEGPAAIS